MGSNPESFEYYAIIIIHTVSEHGFKFHTADMERPLDITNYTSSFLCTTDTDIHTLSEYVVIGLWFKNMTHYIAFSLII